MKIEAGRYYKTRDGRKVGPMSVGDEQDPKWTADIGHLCGSWFHDNGKYAFTNAYNPNDLIAEWTEAPTSPIRTVTRTVTETNVVPGRYGIVQVWTDPLNVAFIGLGPMTAPELRAAALVLTQLADALEGE